MSQYVQDCPRCGTLKVTFDVLGQNSRGIVSANWVEQFELFMVCRHCHKGVIFVAENRNYNSRIEWPNEGAVEYEGVLNDFFEYRGFINIANLAADQPPEHTPNPIAAVFLEGTNCLSIGCWNAAGAMFRSSIDLASKLLLPIDSVDEGGCAANEIPARVRRNLGFRLPWLFENNYLPPELKELSDCIQQDGNDGVHDANLTEAAALDLKDFAYQMFERLYTTPKRLELAAKRRDERRKPAD